MTTPPTVIVAPVSPTPNMALFPPRISDSDPESHGNHS